MRGRRVGVTGLGCLTPIGNGVRSFTEGLRDGRSGVARITLFDPAALDVPIAAEVKGFDPESALSAKELRHVGRVVPLSLAAAGEALAAAGIDPERLSLEERRRIAVVFGTGGGAVDFFERMYGHWYRGDLKKASVYSIPTGTMGTLSSEISMRFGLKGRSHVITTGCTSSADALAYAARLVAWGDEDLVLTGGADAVITPGIMTGFSLMQILSTARVDAPSTASRPFDAGRDGFVLGEGAWMFVLEPLERARARGARVLAEVCGYGTTCDAYHRVRLDESGDEPARAMCEALADAGLSAGRHRLRAVPRHLHAAQRPHRDAGDEKGSRRRGRPHSRQQREEPDRASAGRLGSGRARGYVARDAVRLPSADAQPRDRRPGVRPRLRPERGAPRPGRVRALQRDRVRLEELRAHRPQRTVPLRSMSFWVPRRRPESELLDDDDVPASEAEASLADIEWVHHRLGGRALVRRRFRPLFAALAGREDEFQVLDLGCGSGHVGRDLLAAAAEAGARVRVFGLDRKASHVRLAARGTAVVADAFRLPFGDRSVAVVLSTLFLHHFSPPEIEALFLEARRVAASTIVVLDLTRHRLALAVISVVGPVAFRSRLSVADGKTSVRQAYTPDEIAAIAAPVLPDARVTMASRFVWELVWKRP